MNLTLETEHTAPGYCIYTPCSAGYRTQLADSNQILNFPQARKLISSAGRPVLHSKLFYYPGTVCSVSRKIQPVQKRENGGTRIREQEDTALALRAINRMSIKPLSCHRRKSACRSFWDQKLQAEFRRGLLVRGASILLAESKRYLLAKVKLQVCQIIYYSLRRI